eukprot:Skav217904  [mRNA]  locus=scaffold795:142566:144465:+ [translate_table: standard]
MPVETWLSSSVLKAGFEPSSLDADLRSFALTLWEEPGLSRSNRGGWHSRYLEGNASVLSQLAARAQDVAILFLRKWKSPRLQREEREERETRRRATRIHFAALWANVHEAGDYNVEHQHAEIDAAGDDVPLLSGVYYPQGPNQGAKLHFADCGALVPSLEAKEPTEVQNCSVSADQGTLVMFPATLAHSVQPTRDAFAGPRVSFAFNLMVRHSDSALHAAVMEGNVTATSLLLQGTDRPDINGKDQPCGFTPLHHAAESGHMAVLRLLLDHRADPFALSQHGSLAAHLAAEAGQLNVVKEFLEAAPSLAGAASGSQNRSLVHIAAANGQVDLLKELPLQDFQLKQGDGSTALHCSVQNGHLAATELILKHAPELVDAGHSPPAHEAARGGQVAILSSLLQARADVNGSQGDSLVYWAAHGGHTAILESLLMSKVMLSAPPKDDAKSVSAKGEAVANYLAAALIGEGVRAEELSPMHVAAQAGHSKVLAWLKQQGLSAEEPSSAKMQPIHLAASSGHVEVTEWLLTKSRNAATAKARGDITPLHMASLNGHERVAKLLLEVRCPVFGSASC